jgi:hypothetical protein
LTEQVLVHGDDGGLGALAGEEERPEGFEAAGLPDAPEVLVFRVIALDGS